jgi:L-ascorbate metabolism protein UlaG (beta-lactamase superfamily)
MLSRRPLLGIIVIGAGISVCLKPLAPGEGGASNEFVRGDANADGEGNISDAVYMLGCSFLGTECAACADAADLNDDGTSDITDPIFLLNFLFLGGPALPLPGPGCGPDPTADELGCASFPPCAVSDPDAIPTSRGDLIVTPIEHASVVLRWDQKTIYADPVGGAGSFQGLPAPDLIVVTHQHGDHFDAATIRAVASTETVLIVPRVVSDALAGMGGAGEAQVRVLANGEKSTVGDMEVEAVPMYNITPGRNNHPKGMGNGYVIDLDGTRVYLGGDTEDTMEMRALQDIGLAFLPMNIPFTMTPEQAASAAIEFKPRVVYPYHYRGQDTGKFKSLVEAGTDEVEVRLRNWYP